MVGFRVHVHEAGSFAPLLQVEQGQVFTVVNDHLGMPKELVDGRGRVAWAAAHSAWGRILEEQRDPGVLLAVGSPFRLLGQYADDETGLCWVRFRYFDAEGGRWCSPDPLGVHGGQNQLAFNASPTDSADILGLSSCKGPSRGRLLQRLGDFREKFIKNILRLFLPEVQIIEQAYLRDKNGKIVRVGKDQGGDGKGRRLDFVLIDPNNKMEIVEVTGPLVVGHADP